MKGIIYMYESNDDKTSSMTVYYQHFGQSLILISTWLSNYIHYKAWDEIVYSFSNFNGATVEVWEWISNCIPHFAGYVITYILGLKLIRVSERGPWGAFQKH